MEEVKVTTVVTIPVIYVITYGPETIREDVYKAELELVREYKNNEFKFEFHILENEKDK